MKNEFLILNKNFATKMDPTLRVVTIYDHFKVDPISTLPKTLQTLEVPMIEPFQPQESYQYLDNLQYLEPPQDFIAEETAANLAASRREASVYEISQLRKLLNFSELLGSESRFFLDNSGYLLANLDSLFNLTGFFGSFLVRQSIALKTFATFGEGLGSWSQYLQYRFPEGHVISQTVGSDVFSTQVLNMNNIQRIHRNSFDGEWDSLIQIALQNNPEGIDGVFSNSSPKDPNEIKELVRYTLSVLGGGGSAALRIPLPTTRLLAELITVLRMSFSELSMIKPLADDQLTDSVFVVGKGFLPNKLLKILLTRDSPSSSVTSDTVTRPILTSIFSDPIAEELSNYLKTFNQEVAKNLIDTWSLPKKESFIRPSFNTYKTLTLWKLMTPNIKIVPEMVSFQERSS